MAKSKNAPFVEAPNIQGNAWSEPWRQFLRDISSRINERPEVKGTVVSGNPVTIDSDGNIIDTGSTLPDGTIADEEYVQDYTGERYQTENEVNDAGTEEGARFGSYRIGLLTEDDYAYFDENGKLVFYGSSGMQIITPDNATSTTKFAVFDSSGNLKYRTAEELSGDLSGSLATRDYVSETFITESQVPEAGLEEGSRHGSYRIGLLTEDDYAYFDENGKLIFYGTSGIQLMVPFNASSTEKFAVFDSDGNLKYRTAEQLSEDLDEFLATRQYVSENFITGNTIEEAGTESGYHLGTHKIGRMLQEKVWHAYGGFQNKAEVINVLGAGQWAWITNVTNNLWTGLEADGMALSDDIMTIENAGDYFGTLSMTISGSNGKDFQIRLYNITQAIQTGYVIGASTTGVTNYTNITLPIYIEANAGDTFRMEITCLTDASDPTLRSAVFYLSYLHD